MTTPEITAEQKLQAIDEILDEGFKVYDDLPAYEEPINQGQITGELVLAAILSKIDQIVYA